MRGAGGGRSLRFVRSQAGAWERESGSQIAETAGGGERRVPISTIENQDQKRAIIPAILRGISEISRECPWRDREPERRRQEPPVRAFPGGSLGTRKIFRYAAMGAGRWNASTPRMPLAKPRLQAIWATRAALLSCRLQ